MAKRKNDCNLDNVVAGYLKKQNFEKTLKLFDSRNGGNEDVISAMLADFANFLKQRDRKNQNGAFQPIKKVEIYLKHKYRNNIFNGKKFAINPYVQHPVRINRHPKRPKTTAKPKKLVIPNDFIKTIKKLGLKEENAAILFQTKINWTAVYSTNKIFCTEINCDYFTHLDENLFSHARKVHNCGDYPCSVDHCSYVGYSKVRFLEIKGVLIKFDLQTNLNYHKRMHSMRSDKRFPYKCPIPNCQSRFEYEKDLKRHNGIHNNDVDVCQYCPYRYNYAGNYIRHLRKHFRITEFKCDQCEKEFSTVGDLNVHYAVHEGLIYR